MNLKLNMKCWICGDNGTTREHKAKRSDLRSVFGKPTKTDPLYFNDGTKKNFRVSGLDAKVWKFTSRICANCNNARTQPHDRAWERMSEWFRTRNPTVKPGEIVRADCIFPHDTAREMLNVHLYFVKKFGCHIMDLAVPINIQTFADAIMEDRAHPNVWLKFGCSQLLDAKVIVGESSMATAPSDGSCAFASWFYEVDTVAVNVMFAAHGEMRNGLVGAWNPQSGTNELAIATFE